MGRRGKQALSIILAIAVLMLVSGPAHIPALAAAETDIVSYHRSNITATEQYEAGEGGGPGKHTIIFRGRALEAGPVAPNAAAFFETILDEDGVPLEDKLGGKFSIVGINLRTALRYADPDSEHDWIKVVQQNSALEVYGVDEDGGITKPDGVWTKTTVIEATDIASDPDPTYYFILPEFSVEDEITLTISGAEAEESDSWSKLSTVDITNAVTFFGQSVVTSPIDGIEITERLSGTRRVGLQGSGLAVVALEEQASDFSRILGEEGLPLTSALEGKFTIMGIDMVDLAGYAAIGDEASIRITQYNYALSTYVGADGISYDDDTGRWMKQKTYEKVKDFGVDPTLYFILPDPGVLPQDASRAIQFVFETWSDDDDDWTTFAAVSIDNGVTFTLRKAVVTLGDDEDEFIYDGDAKKPKIDTVELAGIELEDDEYTVSYQDATGAQIAGAPKNAGTYYLVATPKADTDYEGYPAGKAKFVIAPQPLGMEKGTLAVADKVFDGERKITSYTGAPTLTDLIEGDTVNVRIDEIRFLDPNVKEDKKVWVRLAFAGTPNENYTLPKAGVMTGLTGKVTKKELAAGASDASFKVYLPSEHMRLVPIDSSMLPEDRGYTEYELVEPSIGDQDDAPEIDADLTEDMLVLRAGEGQDGKSVEVEIEATMQNYDEPVLFTVTVIVKDDMIPVKINTDDMISVDETEYNALPQRGYTGAPKDDIGGYNRPFEIWYSGVQNASVEGCIEDDFPYDFSKVPPVNAGGYDVFVTIPSGDPDYYPMMTLPMLSDDSDLYFEILEREPEIVPWSLLLETGSYIDRPASNRYAVSGLAGDDSLLELNPAVLDILDGQGPDAKSILGTSAEKGTYDIVFACFPELEEHPNYIIYEDSFLTGTLTVQDAGDYSPGGGTGGSNTPETEGNVTVLEPPVSTVGGESVAVIDAETAEALVQKAIEDNSVAILIAPVFPDDADTTVIEFPLEALTKLAEEAGIPLIFSGPVAEIELDVATMKSILDASDGEAPTANLTFRAEVVSPEDLPETTEQHILGGHVVDLTMQAGNVTITEFGTGKVTMTVPYDKKTYEDDRSYEVTAYLLSDTGDPEEIGGVAYDTEKRAAEVPLDHLSLYALLTELTVPFTDIKDHWGEGHMKWVYRNDLFAGVSATAFGPQITMTRGMVVTVLYKMDGYPESAAANIFDDVRESDYYAAAVAWAAGEGIVAGVGGGKFAPERAVTRQELSVMLYQYAAYKGYDMSARGDMGRFTDTARIADWALDGMTWLVGTGVLNGRTSGEIDPRGSAARVDAASLLRMFVRFVADA